MQTVGLMLCGAVLFLNALMLLGHVDQKSAGLFNIFIGAIQIITPFYVIFTAGADQWTIFNASGVFLFGLTFLFVGISNLTNYSSSGIGWFSLWVAVLALAYSTISFTQFDDVKFGIIWLMWAFLWTLFFLLLALNKNIAVLTGWVTLIEALLTATIPGFLILIGQWDQVSTALAEIISLLFVITFIALYYRTRQTIKYRQGSSEPVSA
ncbi:acetamide transporter [Paenibacillus sp. CCS19]|uniref:AmiS/UreI family transporter n=1 Tax=Paenibacillus sp. CCS19 TaxID=3158387 RepID=UPI0025612214|nr:AmiS/UreI family transporter [Paenibacillus cellulosilyticus]GMK38853.1 acetamide transporter [Paenibacillus cellulosilyticus]